MHTQAPCQQMYERAPDGARAFPFSYCGTERRPRVLQLAEKRAREELFKNCAAESIKETIPAQQYCEQPINWGKGSTHAQQYIDGSIDIFPMKET